MHPCLEEKQLGRVTKLRSLLLAHSLLTLTNVQMYISPHLKALGHCVVVAYSAMQEALAALEAVLLTVV